METLGYLKTIDDKTLVNELRSRYTHFVFYGKKYIGENDEKIFYINYRTVHGDEDVCYRMCDKMKQYIEQE